MTFSCPGLVILGLMTGLVRCEISSCYKVGPAPEYSRMFYSSHSEVDQSWINSTVLDLVQPVPDYEECQVLCQVRKTTLDWNVLIWPVWRTLSGARPGLGLTRTTRTGPIIAGCTPTLTLIFSGPKTCLCSRVEECLVYGDTELDLVPNVF